MKKFTKILSIFCVFLVGALCLGACGKKAEDPFKNQEVTTAAKFNEYILDSKVTTIMDNFKYVKTEEKDGKTLEIQFIYYERNDKDYAYLNIDDDISQLKAEVYVTDQKMYINNGTEKYYVNYDLWTLNQTDIEAKRIAEHIFEYRNVNDLSKFLATKDSLQGKLLDSLKLEYYVAEKDTNKNFKLSYDELLKQTSTITLTQKNEGKIYFSKDALKKIEFSHEYNKTTTESKDNTKVEKDIVKEIIENFTGTISLPKNLKDYVEK